MDGNMTYPRLGPYRSFPSYQTQEDPMAQKEDMSFLRLSAETKAEQNNTTPQKVDEAFWTSSFMKYFVYPMIIFAGACTVFSVAEHFMIAKIHGPLGRKED